MQLLIDSYKKDENLHHAYAFEGDADLILDELIDFFKKELKISVQGNPDYWYGEHEVFGIDEARLLAETQMRKSFSGGRKIFVIRMQGITAEAQNALLKVFEEPTPQTHFFLILNSFDQLIPTLKSRIFFVGRKEREDTETLIKKGKNFLHSSISERISEISKIGEEKNKVEAEKLLNSIELALAEEIKKEKTDELISSLEEVYKVKEYLSDRSSSVKMLLEHIAHTVHTK